jgi:hypothetical protein
MAKEYDALPALDAAVRVGHIAVACFPAVYLERFQGGGNLRPILGPMWTGIAARFDL